MDEPTQQHGPRLLAIAAAVEAGNYKRGAWQQWLAEAMQDPDFDPALHATSIDATSNALHRRHGFRELPFDVVYCLEWLLAIAGLTTVFSNSVAAVILGTTLLALSAQPLIKVTLGLLLGVRYAYTYLWYVEPRFKMRYSSYLGLAGQRRVLLHLGGSVGTPVALSIGCWQAWELDAMLWAGLIGVCAFGATALQIAAFVAQMMGVKTVAGFRLADLTSPATAAREWQELRRRTTPAATDSF